MRLALVVLAAACSDSASPRTTTRTSGTAILLRYQPANMSRYRIDATVKTPPGAVVPLELARSIDVEVTADERQARARIGAGDPYAAFDLGDAVEAAVLLFPALPAQPVAPGERWPVALAITVEGTRVDLSHELTYVGEVPCPSGARGCALLAVAAPARNAVVRAWIATYRLDGTIHVDRARGSVEAAQLRASGNIANGPANVTIDASVVATPVGRNGLD